MNAQAPPPPPVPGDDKDWTWVNERRCPECGFDASTTDPTSVPDLLRANVREWQAILTRSDVRDRPRPDVWSPLEYAGHVRDVFDLYRLRLDRMLREDGPHYENWDPDAAAVAARYDLADPAAISEDLTASGTALADLFGAVQDDDWHRTGHRSDGATFTVATFATYLAHDPVHHVWDATEGVR